jgi:hypothetical protein
VKNISAKLTDGRTLKLDVVEFLPFEPSNYVWEAGWIASDDETDYFVSESGDVFLGDKSVGIAHEIRAEADRRERELDSDDREEG